MKPALLLAVLLIADNATEAGVRFKRGVELYQAGRVREALEQFMVSYRLSPNPNLAFNIGTCFEELKSHDAAFSAYSEYLSFDLSPKERAEGREALDRIIPKVARITVRSKPKGAAIYLDRETLGQYGTTPRTFAAPPGDHEVILRLDGWVTATRAVELIRGEEIDVALTLERRTGVVRVSSDPPGSEVRLRDREGEILGETPATLELPIGSRQLHLHLDGHADEIRRVEVRADETARLFVAHRPLPPKKGRLRILTNIPSALITVDDREVGFSPLVLELAEGEHRIQVHQPGYRTWSDRVSIRVGRPLAAEVTLEPKQQEVGRGPWPWALLAGSAVAGIAGLGLSITALQRRADFEAEPGLRLLDQTKALNVAADVMWAVTLVGGAATVAAFLFGEDRLERDSKASIMTASELVEPGPPSP